MRVDSMDAISLPYVRNSVGSQNAGNDSRDAAAVQETSGLPIDVKSLGKLTEFEKRELPISDKVVIEAIEKANRAIMGANRKFEFSIHEKTKEIMIKVIDSDTNQVIREIPPEKILDMVAKIWEMAGIIVDERR